MSSIRYPSALPSRAPGAPRVGIAELARRRQTAQLTTARPPQLNEGAASVYALIQAQAAWDSSWALGFVNKWDAAARVYACRLCCQSTYHRPPHARRTLLQEWTSPRTGLKSKTQTWKTEIPAAISRLASFETIKTIKAQARKSTTLGFVRGADGFEIRRPPRRLRQPTSIEATSASASRQLADSRVSPCQYQKLPHASLNKLVS